MVNTNAFYGSHNRMHYSRNMMLGQLTLPQRGAPVSPLLLGTAAVVGAFGAVAATNRPKDKPMGAFVGALAGVGALALFTYSPPK